VVLHSSLIAYLSNKGHKMATKKQNKKVGKVMGEYKEGTLHSGKGGPVVTDRKQAIAISLSEAKMPQRGQRTAKNKAKKK